MPKQNPSNQNNSSNIFNSFFKIFIHCLNIINNKCDGLLSGIINDMIVQFGQIEGKLMLTGVTINPKHIYHKIFNQYCTNTEAIIFKDCTILAPSFNDEQYSISSKFTPNKLKTISFINVSSRDHDEGEHIIKLLEHPAVQQSVKSITIQGVNLGGAGEEIMWLIKKYNLDDLILLNNEGLKDLEYHYNQNLSLEHNNIVNLVHENDACQKIMDENTKLADKKEAPLVKEANEVCVQAVLKMVSADNVLENIDYILKILRSDFLPKDAMHKVYEAAAQNNNLTPVLRDVIKSVLPIEVTSNSDDFSITTNEISAISKIAIETNHLNIIKSLLRHPDVENINLSKELILSNPLSHEDNFELGKICQVLYTMADKPEHIAIDELLGVINEGGYYQ